MIASVAGVTTKTNHSILSKRTTQGTSPNFIWYKDLIILSVSRLSLLLGCGFSLAVIENTPVLLTRPLLESMPLHLGEITAQALDVRSIPCTIEPREHQRQLFALGT